MIATRHTHRGFALPTILIASVVMLVVLVSAVGATSSVRSALDGQYYNRLAREAAESGIARASSCLHDNAYLVQWSNTNNLRPNTACTGGAACTNASTCFVMDNSSIRTTFAVGLPVDDGTTQHVTSTGKVELLRASSGVVWRTYTYTASARIGVELGFDSVSFAYAGGYGAYFMTLTADGVPHGTGFNDWGQLGNGTTNDSLTPTDFGLSGADRAVSVFTNFLSSGFNTFVITNAGTVYGSGLNGNGQLGDGSTTSRTTPVQFGLPAGATAKHVNIGGFATYVVTTNNNIYAAGACHNGRLGYTYTISGCANQPTYKRVALPTPTSDPNTLPTTNIVSDGESIFVRMQGGKVYGWGGNEDGQLVTGGVADTATPVQVGTFGNAGQPKATQIATDGDTIWVLDDNQDVWAAGRNEYGQLGGPATIKIDSIGECLDDVGQFGTNVQLYPCNDGPAQDWAWRTDGTLYNSNTDKCINVAADNVDVTLAACSTSTRQKWTLRDDKTIMNTATGKCLNNQGSDGVTVIVFTCVANPNEYFTLPSLKRFTKVALPASAANATEIATDQWSTSILTDTGEVWSMGRNIEGQLGKGSANTYQPALVKFVLPAGVTATDVTTTGYYNVPFPIVSNTFVIGSDGKVYGAGVNSYGQLGDGTTTNRTTPVAMNVIDGTAIKAKEVKSGYGTTVVLTYGKKLYTVGNNASGQLGDGTTTNSSTPAANQYTNVLPVSIF